MTTTLDMEDIRNLNLFKRITLIKTRFCFSYNNTIFFCVPRSMLMKAIGREGRNVKTMNQILKKRIRIIPSPEGISDIKRFIESIVSPVTFKDIGISENEVILNAGSQSKAALIGRDKRRLIEMHGIIKDFFGKDFRIV